MRGYIPFAATIRGAPDGQHAERESHILVNADGSIHISDWEFLQIYYETSVGYDSPEFTILTLLLAARGHIKECGLREAHTIAMATLADRAMQGLDDVPEHEKRRPN